MGKKKVSEFGDSLDDRIALVRGAFEKQFPVNIDPDGESIYVWVTDVFDDYVVCRLGDKYFEVGFAEDGDSLVFDSKDDWVAVKLSYVAEMKSGHFRDTMFISEFKGKYPDVPFSEGVDYQELIAGDDNPVFVTLPIGMVNVTSGNKRYYDEKFIQELERQVIAKKPIGLMGHLRSDQRATDFPAEAVHWVGAQRVNELLWGKGYIPAGEPRNRLQRYKATSKKIATSIDATAEGVWDKDLDAYRMNASTLNLAQIDIAPADRAGIADLSAIPFLTTEMSDAVREDRSGEDQEMDREEVIKSLTVADVPNLPKEVYNEIVEMGVQEIASELNLGDGVGIFEYVSGLREQARVQEQQAVSARIQELAIDPENGVKLESVRDLVIEMVRSRNPNTVAEAEAAYSEISASPAVIKAQETVVKETMGPSQKTPVASQSSNKPGKFFVIPTDVS